jgi:hypothetical protein
LADRIDGIKIDVQGMEIQVLTGMVGLLKTSKPKLVVERGGRRGNANPRVDHELRA